MTQIPIKTFMTIYLSALLVLSGFWLGQPARIFWGACVVVVFCVTDLAWTYINRKVWYVPSSSIISALIIALVFDTISHPILALLAAVIAVASKHTLRFGRRRHLMNPAAFAMVVMSLFAPVVAWWGSGWGTLPLGATFLVGCYLLYRLRRFDMAIAFVASYLAALLLQSGFKIGWNVVPSLAMALLFDGTLIFFATVMLIEPVTASYATKKQRITFGVVVGILAAVISLIPRFWPLRTMDPLLLALVIGNMVMGLKIISRLPSQKISGTVTS